MITLDGAIMHCEEVAENQDKLCKRYDDASGYSRSHNETIRTNDAKKCEECAEEHRQLAEWLRKLKKYEEGIEKTKELMNDYKGCDMWDTANGLQLALECLEVNADDNN